MIVLIIIKNRGGILFLIAVFVVTVSVIAALIGFGYKTILTNSIAKKDAELTEKYNSLPRSEIDEYVRTSEKFKAGQEILNNHLAVAPIFFLLEDSTLKRLRFTELNYTYLSNNKVAIALKGEAKSFEVVAKQSDTFSQYAKKFNSPIFSNLNRNDKGNVVFSFLTTVDPSLVNYREAIKSYPSTYNDSNTNNISTSTQYNKTIQ